MLPSCVNASLFKTREKKSGEKKEMERKVRTHFGRGGSLSSINLRVKSNRCMTFFVKEPTEELVMLRVRESAQRSQFYLGKRL